MGRERCLTDGIDPTGMKRQRQGLSRSLSQAARRPAGSRRSSLPQPRGPADQAGGHQGAGRLQAQAMQLWWQASVAVDNTLDRQFDVAAPYRAWVTDITYIRTLKGFAYLGVAVDLYLRRMLGCRYPSGGPRLAVK